MKIRFGILFVSVVRLIAVWSLATCVDDASVLEWYAAVVCDYDHTTLLLYRVTVSFCLSALCVSVRKPQRRPHLWYFSWFSVLILSRCSSVAVVFSLRKLFLIKRRRKTLVSGRKSCRHGIGCCSHFHPAFVSTQRCHLFSSDKYLLCLRKLTPFVRISQGERKAREFGCFHRGARQVKANNSIRFFHRWQVFCRRHEFLLFFRLSSRWVRCKNSLRGNPVCCLHHR